MRIFEAFHLGCDLVVGDGAATNMTVFRHLATFQPKSFGVGIFNENSDDRFQVPSYFDNPYRPGNPVFIVPCPSHLLKNLVNSLFASRPGGTKALQLQPNGNMFGWKSIVSLYERDKARQAKGQMRRVRGLLKSFIVRDSWTKMNCFAAKILQEFEAIAELL